MAVSDFSILGDMDNFTYIIFYLLVILSVDMGVCQAENECSTKQSLPLLYVSFAKKTSFRHYLQTTYTMSFYESRRIILLKILKILLDTLILGIYAISQK